MAEQQQRIDIQDYWRILWRRKWIAILCLLLVLLIGFVGSFFIDPVYEARTVLMSESGRERVSRGLEQILPKELQGARGDRARQIISSSTFLGVVADNTGLSGHPFVERKARKLAGKLPEITYDEVRRRVAVDILRKWIGVRSDGSDIFSIVTRANTPDLAYELNQVVVDTYIERVRTGQLDQMAAATQFAFEQLAVYEEKLRNSERKLLDFRGELARRPIEGDPLASTDASNLSTQISQTRIDLRSAEAEEGRLASLLDERGVTRSQRAQVLGSRDVAARMASGKVLERQYATVLAEFGESSGNAIRVAGQVSGNQQLLRQATESYLALNLTDLGETARLALKQWTLYTSGVAALDARLAELQSIKSRLEQRAVEAPGEELDAIALESEVNSDRALVEYWRQQVRNAQITRAVESTEGLRSSIQVLEPAMKPFTPSAPDRAKITVVSALLGSMLAFGFAFLLEYMDRSLKSITEMESFIGLPVLGIMPGMAIQMEDRRAKRDRTLWTLLITFMALWIVAASVLLFLRSTQG